MGQVIIFTRHHLFLLDKKKTARSELIIEVKPIGIAQNLSFQTPPPRRSVLDAQFEQVLLAESEGVFFAFFLFVNALLLKCKDSHEIEVVEGRRIILFSF
jgi:hypothetical protein